MRLTAEAYIEPGSPGRDDLALAALLSGSAIDASWYGLHHVCAQTLRTVGVGHGQANAVLLPHTARALRERAPGSSPRSTRRPGCRSSTSRGGSRRWPAPSAWPRSAWTRTGSPDLADAAAARQELALTPPAATRDELLALYRAAA